MLLRIFYSHNFQFPIDTCNLDRHHLELWCEVTALELEGTQRVQTHAVLLLT